MVSWPDDPLLSASVALGIAGSALAVVLAGLVLRADPRRGVNRRLAALLAAEGLVHALVVARLDVGVAATRALATVHFASVTALPALYLLFLATLATPLVRALRGDAARAFLLAYACLMPAAAALLTLEAAPAVGGPPAPVAGLYRASLVLVGAASLFGLAAAVSEVRRTRGRTAERGRAVAYAWAFGARDAFFALTVLNVTLVRSEATEALWPSLATFLFVPLLAYGFLRSHVLDIDLKIRWTLERGTVALVFVGLYLAASQAAQATVSERYGPLFGVGAAALLVFALVPLRRLAGRVGDALMPGVRETPEYLRRRRLEVYQAALEQAHAAGAPSAAERAILASLREKLGLAEGEAAALEYAVAERRGRAEGLAPGDLALGKYRILRAIGEGRHGRAWLAEHAEAGRRVVVKEIAATGPEGAADALREARATAAIRHPNVVTLHDVERVGARVVLVVEHAEGGTLRDRLEAGPLAPDEFRRVAVGLLAALEAVHRAGIVHRDVKPSNVLLTSEGEPKLADFGVALDRDATLAPGALPSGVGTPRYMSPEQARGRRPTPRSDLYSVAATLYEAWTGRPWIEGGDDAQEVRSRAAAPRPFDPAFDGPPALAAWLARALDPEPERRFADAREARVAIEAALA